MSDLHKAFTDPNLRWVRKQPNRDGTGLTSDPSDALRNDAAFVLSFKEQDFALIEKDPDSWIVKSGGLLETARALWESFLRGPLAMNASSRTREQNQYVFEMASPFMMLCGYALEVLMKGALVKQAKKPKTIHDLEELWDLVDGLKGASDKPTSLLKRLSNFAVFYGRYPVPRQKDWGTAEKKWEVRFSDWDLVVATANRIHQLMGPDVQPLWVLETKFSIEIKPEWLNSTGGPEVM